MKRASLGFNETRLDRGQTEGRRVPRLQIILRQELRRLEAERRRVECQIRTIRFILMEPMVRSWPAEGKSGPFDCVVLLLGATLGILLLKWKQAK